MSLHYGNDRKEGICVQEGLPSEQNGRNQTTDKFPTLCISHRLFQLSYVLLSESRESLLTAVDSVLPFLRLFETHSAPPLG